MTTDTPALACVAAMIRAWEARDTDAIVACFAEESVWHNMPYPPIRGRVAIGAAIGRFVDSATDICFIVHHLAEIASGVVVTERNDVFTLKDGRSLDIPLMGIFEITDGRIVAWRDYFDAAAMTG